ncbi:MAG: sigma-70 family RNA polymerase sigma factor [Gomphosphaeria aponina SAG 52.96 = DSM 107014]|uniref:Sigma-70 family RNA polymerase sigma factor n=1 Tax=Gomphosphaeria aponina SAG 52.96 = DSM 107014 TaxID=1521640 RepID=A0A941GWQ0_9CHRO|nr:sigma-70 family RNA polymerase sigma factor [Gomphosphaeria aponina SAG 52.96 = DSM 107014]
MEIPSYPESNHPLVQFLAQENDEKLLIMFQEYPEQGKYFTAIFCRYSSIIYRLIFQSLETPLLTDYIFTQIWGDIFYEMRGLVLNREGKPEFSSLQNWLLYLTTLTINEQQLPDVKSIPSDFQPVSPPLICYLEQALDLLPPMMRFIFVMTEKFNWSQTRIAAYLQAEGETITPTEIEKWLKRAYKMLESAIPEDIRLIYLDGGTISSEWYFQEI